MTLHEYFLQFLTEWLQWAEANKNLRTPSESKFSTGCGLCVTWRKWLHAKAADNPHDFCADPTEAAQAHMRQVAIKEGIYSPDGDYFGWSPVFVPDSDFSDADGTGGGGYTGGNPDRKTIGGLMAALGPDGFNPHYDTVNYRRRALGQLRTFLNAR